MQTIEMIKNSIPTFDYSNKMTKNNDPRRYALVINQINHEIKQEKAKLKEQRKQNEKNSAGGKRSRS